MEYLKVSVNNGVQKITFNRPEKRNALSVTMYEQLTNILNTAATDDNVKLTVLTGEGDFYSSGNDLSGRTSVDYSIERSLNILRRMVAAFIDYPKILIALVNGPAIGIAVTTLGLCDIVIASDKAYFTTPFSKIGLTAEGCSSVTFPKIMGPRKVHLMICLPDVPVFRQNPGIPAGYVTAMEMLYFGHKMSAEEAKQYRFVNDVVPHSKLNSVWEVFYKYASFPKESILSTKHLVRKSNQAALHAANEAECQELLKRVQSEEFLTNLQKYFTRSSKL